MAYKYQAVHDAYREYWDAISHRQANMTDDEAKERSMKAYANMETLLYSLSEEEYAEYAKEAVEILGLNRPVEEKPKMRMVITHGNCLDGFTAAWAVWKVYGDADTEYVHANFGEAPPDVTGKDVVIVDFHYKRPVLLAMAEKAKSIVLIDHHKTAEAELADLPFVTFDMKRSGAGMAWDLFHGPTTRPILIDYVEDRDLWKFKHPKSVDVNAWINAHQRTTFQDWQALSDELTQDGVDKAAEKGAHVTVYIDRYVHEMAAQARMVDWLGYKVPVVNAPYISISELVAHLAKGQPFAVGWYQRGDGMFQYSLRSDGAFDVSEVALKFGGGGHKTSAGFEQGTLLGEFR